MTKPAFWLALTSVGALIACDPPTGDIGDTGDTANTANTVDGDVPTGDASLQVTNRSGYTFYYVWQCEDPSNTCYDALGSSVLEDGEVLSLPIATGDWYTIVVDEDDYCATSGIYSLAAGDSFSWEVTAADLYRSWDGDICY